MYQQHLLADDDVQPLAEAAMEVLERVGLVCQNEELLQVLAGAGCELDLDAERARFPKTMVTAFVEQLRKDTAGKATPRDDGFPKLDPPALTMQVAQFYYDTEAGEKRQGNAADFIELIKLGEVLHGEQGVGHALTLTDIDPLLEPLEVGMLLAEYTDKPQQPFVNDIRQMDYLLEMGEIIGIGDWFSFGAFTFAHPLRFDRDTAAKFVHRVRAGRGAGLVSMAVAGMSTPVTLEGFVVAAAAEFLKTHDEFVLETPPWPFNESELTEPITHYPGGWLRRL